MVIPVLFFLLAVVQARNIDRKFTATTDVIASINKDSKTLADGQLFEGDIMIPKHQKMHRRRKNAVAESILIWEAKEIPYEIDQAVGIAARLSILSAIGVFEKKTCIRFRERDPADEHGVKFVLGNGCWSHIGHRVSPDKNYQEVSLAPQCITKGIILHELMHTLGFFHEHSRHDRDEYIQVLWENINPVDEKHFELVDTSVSTFKDAVYDFNSLMHYGNLAFSENGKPTLQAKGKPEMNLGRDSSLSEEDINKINRLYQCHNMQSDRGWSKWSKWSECRGDRKRRRERHCPNFDASLCDDASGNGFQMQEKSC